MLDQPIQPPANPPVGPTAIRYGVIGGLLSVVLALAFQLTGLTDPASGKGGWLSAILSAGLTFGVIYMGTAEYKKAAGGNLTFGKGLGVGMMIVLIMTLISTVYTLLYFTVIDPGMIDQIKNASIAQMEEQGLSDEQIDQSMKMMGMMVNPFMMAIFGFAGGLFFGFILSLVTSAIHSSGGKKPQTL